MALGNRLKTKTGVQVALMPVQKVNITQGYGGTYSHTNTYNLDNASGDGFRQIPAPFDMKVAVAGGGGLGITIYHSINKVMTPSGLSHLTMVLMHDNGASRWTKDRTFIQGQHCYTEGNKDSSGLSTGIHVHMEFALGHETQRIQTGGNFHIRNQVKAEDAVFINNIPVISFNQDAGKTTTPQLTEYKETVIEWYDEYQTWLSETQSLNNAQIIITYLYRKNRDWSKESISALLGNMRHESSVNPNMYEYGFDWNDDRGFGLVQWTPRSKLWNWAEGKGLNARKGETQLQRIDYEVANNIQWIAIARFNRMTFKEFRTNSGNWSVEYLTEAFTWSYERPNATAGETSMPARKAFANKVFSTLNWYYDDGTEPDIPEPEPEIPEPEIKKMDDIMVLYMMDILKGGFS